MRKTRGLTLSEIIVALGVMTALSLVVIAIFTKLLASSTKSTDLTTANLLARSLLDRAVRQGPPDWGNAGNFSRDGGTIALETGEAAATKFTYQISPVKVTNAPDPNLGQLYNVTVEVRWWDPEQKRGMGKLSTTLSRTVYIRE